jgi:hypothetical protein
MPLMNIGTGISLLSQRNNTLILDASHSNHMTSAYTSNNYGDFAPGLYIGEDNTKAETARVLLLFSLTSIPVSAKIISAKIQLTVSSDLSSNARTMRAYKVIRPWVYNQATWNLSASGTSWGTAGCGSITDCYQNDSGSVDFSASEAIDTVKIINLDSTVVQDWVKNSATNFGILLKMDTELNDEYIFYGLSYATTTKRPKLIISYA